MKKNMLCKDFFMEIRTSWGRFVSIFFIVALGVAFYSGIRASEPSMRISGDSYFDSENLMDIKVMGTMGLTEDDVEAIEKVDGIELAEGSYSVDLLCPVDDTENVVHVMAMEANFNNIQVSEGRLPEKEGECLLDEDFAAQTDYEIGDTITFSTGDDSTVTDSLTTDTFTITGFGNSPLYISIGRGNSTVGNGEVSGFVAVDKSSFSMDVYSEIYVRVTGALDTTAFTEEYETLTENAVQALEDIADEQCEARRQEIVSEAEEELRDAQDTVDEESQTLEDAKAELEEARSSAARELADAREQLAQAEETLQASRTQIAQGEAQLEAGKAELASRQSALTEGLRQYEDGLAQVEAEEQSLNQAEAAYLTQYAQQMPIITAGKEQIAEKREELNGYLAPLETVETALNGLNSEISSLNTKIEEGDLRAEELQARQEEGQELTEEEKAFLESWETSARPELEDQVTALEMQKSGILQQAGAAAGIPDLTEEVFQQTIQEVRDGLETLNSQEQELLAGEQELLAYGQQIQDGKTQIAQAKEQLAASKADIDAGQAQINAAWALLNGQAQTLADGKAQLASGEQELAEGYADYENGAAEAASQIAEGQTQIDDGEAQLTEARQEIADARAEIEKIENPEWYVQDRNEALTEYQGYGDNADRMRELGRVFPAVFFLVAALISLTAMTRMVEEQRIQIGTLKALGYSKLSIAGKYIAYALTATLGGSIFGVLFGEKVFPWIIIYAYKIIYMHVPDILVPYHMSYAVQATLIAVLCTLAATILSCYKELAAVPAELMRPPSPRQGKRIFLERIGILWRRLSFIWKSSIRNLVRYKKRFFMTVFGIGGCMALMLVGFGLKDCIFEIPDLQYGEIQFYDAAVYYDAGIEADEKEAIMESVTDSRNVEEAIQVRMQNVDVHAGDETLGIYLTVPENAERMENFVSFHSRTDDETYRLKDDEVILTEKAADVLNVGVGDTVTLNDNDLGERELTVGAVCENYMGHYLYVTPELYEEIYGAQPQYNGILFRMEDGKAAQAEKVGSTLLENENVLNVSYTSSIEDQLDDMLQSLNLVIVVLIISAGLLAFVVLYNLNTINITERRRELATIKVLGFFDTEVAAYVYRENVLLTVIGMLAGSVLGRLLLQFVVVTVEVDDIMFGRVIHGPSYLYSILFTIGFSMFVNWVMYFKLKKIDMVESLKSVE